MSQDMFQKTKYLVKYVYEQYNMKRMTSPAWNYATVLITTHVVRTFMVLIGCRLNNSTQKTVRCLTYLEHSTM